MKIYLDPSINQTGYAIKNNKNIITSGVIKTKGNTDADKLKILWEKLEHLIVKYDIKEAIIEEPDSFTYNRSKNKWNGNVLNQKAINKLFKSIGIIEVLCRINNLKIKSVSPLKWKGFINKKQTVLLTGIKNHNEADAVLMSQIV